MAVDVIRHVGCGGHFLQEEHTVKHMREEQSFTSLFDCRPYGQWKAEGAKDLATRAHEKMLYILETHQPDLLDSGTMNILDQIIRDAGGCMGIKINRKMNRNIF